MLKSPLRVLNRVDVDDVLALCRKHPVESVMVHSLLIDYGDVSRLGGQLWGHYNGEELLSVCWAGANIVPVALTPAAVESFATKARREGRRCSSLVGPAQYVRPLWSHLEPWWGKARDTRLAQPLMVTDQPSSIEPDPDVRSAQLCDLEVLIPASIQMFTEEVGYSPVAGGNYSAYASRVTDLVERRRSFVRIEHVAGKPMVVFKADVGALSDTVAQIQGVWVHPRLRGLGLAAPAMASVVTMVREEFGVSSSLYVNHYNERAIRSYLRAGFTTVGEFATVLF